MTFTPGEVRAIGRSLIRQPANPTESSRTLYILQQQLRDLGYAITLVDGIDSQELRTAARHFATVNGMPANAAPLDIVRSVDTEYGRVFGERGYVIG
jgi:peptidoglycan hydrolase-like protein with peptidoglycan-binding domain